MISVAGRLIIKIINGRHGPFRVGTLQTDVGDFAVKDQLLDQYDEGSYQGMFDIRKIFSSTYSTGSRLVVEVRAVLENIALENVDSTEPDAFASLEQDPLDEELDSQAVGKTSSQTGAIETESDETADVESSVSIQADSTDCLSSEDGKEGDPDAALFGVLWPLQDSFKLDPTVDRSMFRQQRERLKVLGYRFKPVGQYWTKE